MTPSLAFDRTRGVSPVIGVVLLVAIVVILASTVGVFVLGLAQENQTTTPTVVIDAEYEQVSSAPGDSLRLTVQSGDPLQATNLEVRVDDGVVKDYSGRTTDIGPAHAADSILDPVSTEFQAGETIVLELSTVVDDTGSGYMNGGLDLSDATVRLVWQDGGTSDVLWTWTAE